MNIKNTHSINNKDLFNICVDIRCAIRQGNKYLDTDSIPRNLASVK